LPRSLRTLTPILLAVLFLSVVPPGTSAQSPADAPVWALGQRWSYEGTVWGPGPREDFTANVSVIAMSSEEARVRAAISYGFGIVVQETLVALPTLRVLAFDASFPSGIRHRFDYDPPLELLSFPLSAGKAWSSVSNFTYSYSTRPLMRVSTPAGAFDAYPVEQDAMGIPIITLELILPGLGHAVLYYAADVGQIVRYEAFSRVGTLVAEFAITEFSSPSVPSRSAIDPAVNPAIGVVALLLAGASAASTVQILRTVDPTQGRRRRATEADPAPSQKPGRGRGKA